MSAPADGERLLASGASSAAPGRNAPSGAAAPAGRASPPFAGPLDECLAVTSAGLMAVTLIAFIFLAASLGKYAALCSAITDALVVLGILLAGFLIVAVLWLRGARQRRTLASARSQAPIGSGGAHVFPGKHSGSSVAGAGEAGAAGPGDVELRVPYDDAYVNAGGRAECGFSGLCCAKWACFAVGACSMLALWVALGMFQHLSRSTVPDVVAQLQYTALQADVTISREPNGVIHIEAQNLHDAVFGQGVAHAQERLWQMEFQRRVGAGRLAEVAGNAALDIDKQMRTFGFYKAAEASYTSLDTSTKAAVDAYVAGVNAYLADAWLPIEFWLLNYTPEPWKPADSLVWAKLMSFDLSGNMRDELQRYQLLSHGLTKTRIDQLMPAYDATRYPIAISEEDLQGGGRLPPHESSVAAGSTGARELADDATTEWLERFASSEAKLREARASAPASSTTRDSRGPMSARSLRGQLKGLLGVDVLMGGASHGNEDDESEAGQFKHVFGGFGASGTHMGASNNWVVHGNLTSTGKPFLCNDPHLQLMAPSIWILNHLRYHEGNERFDAIGASFAGLPGVVIGHNKHIAWGVTNTGADVQDLYMMEDKEGSNGDFYKYKGDWVPYNKTVETFAVKGEANFTMTVRHSLYGPVVTDNGVTDEYGHMPLSLHWVSIMPESVADTTMNAFMGINRAKNWNDYRDALRSYVAPSQNFIFADSGTGDIGYQMPGKIPKRGEGHSGAYPVPGNGDYDWQGYIDFDDLPRTFNPKRGFVATANNRITPDNYAFNITTDWDAGSTGYRAARITDMIEAGVSASGDPEARTAGLTKQDMQNIQTDYHSFLAHDLMPIALALRSSNLNASGAAALAALKSWTGPPYDVSVGSRQATVFEYWYRQIALLGGPETHGKYWQNGAFIRTALTSDGTPGGSDPACTSQGHATCTAFAEAAMNEAGAQLFGTDGSGAVDDVPAWGVDTHFATFVHQILGKTPLACLADREISHGGDRGTVNVGSYAMKDFQQAGGPSYRQVVDLGELGQSVYLNPLGQSGNLFSPHYADLLPLWSQGEYLAMTYESWTSASSQQLHKP